MVYSGRSGPASRGVRARRFSLLLAAVALFVGGNFARAQATSDPIPTPAPLAPWRIELAEIVQIPESEGYSPVLEAPALEQLVFNESTAQAYVIDQRGPIYAFDPYSPNPTPSLFVDLRVVGSPFAMFGEAGLRSIAFHPDFGIPGTMGHRKFYVTFTRFLWEGPVGIPVRYEGPVFPEFDTVVAELSTLASGEVDLDSYRELIRVGHPSYIHIAGHLGFDPTASPGSPEYGLLFISFGDGGDFGAFGGFYNIAQDVSAANSYPHGKILRINPIAPDLMTPYSIPTSNPFAGETSLLQETWAYGFRNPHKFHWDRVTGRMYVSDIGQDMIEEISVVRPGRNYGWYDREGAYIFAGYHVLPLPPDHATDGFEYPVLQYDHFGNGLSERAAIAGGPIYRGEALPALSGTLFFGDIAAGPAPIFAVHVSDLAERPDLANLASLEDGRIAPYREVLIVNNEFYQTFRTVIRISLGDDELSRVDMRFGEGENGEIYLLNKKDGWVRKIVGVPGHPGPPQVVPMLLPASFLSLLCGAIGVGAFRVGGLRPSRWGSQVASRETLRQ